MKALILSCNTGEGHNAAGKAVKEQLERAGHSVIMMDTMMLSGEKTSKLVGGAYVKMATYTPKLFYLLYQLGMTVSIHLNGHKSPVYFANTLLGKKLRSYLDQEDVDVIVMPHLYPAEIITYLKKHGGLKEKTVVIATDYTCIPFWEETDCDYYVLPHEDLMEEYEERGIAKENLKPFGIPVKQEFTVGFRRSQQQREEIQRQARRSLHLPENKVMYLVMSGSMGFGKLVLFVYEMTYRCKQGEQIVVICGNNKKIRENVTKRFGHRTNVHIIGFTNQVSVYMDACDVIFTKPGGLTSTEALVHNIPIVHTAPIPGCESANVEFFVTRGLSVAAKRIHTQIKLGQTLVKNEKMRERMLEAQQLYAHPQAAEDIVTFMEKICKD